MVVVLGSVDPGEAKVVVAWEMVMPRGRWSGSGELLFLVAEVLERILSETRECFPYFAGSPSRLEGLTVVEAEERVPSEFSWSLPPLSFGLRSTS